MFTAVKLSNDKDTKSGFAIKDEAEKYISGFLCDYCKNALDLGYEELDMEDGTIERYTIDTPLATDCGAEWLIITDDEFESSDGIKDLFISSGMVPGSDSTWDKLTIDQKCCISNKMKD